MYRRRLFLAAYACSGLAGLIYEVSWTRLLTLYMGHTTAATSTVVAAFMGGLAGGALVAGQVAPRMKPRQCLFAYIALECFVGVAALLLPRELRALRPLLVWTYQNGASGVLFPLARVFSSLVLILLPAAALGATFPLAVRWASRWDAQPVQDAQSDPGKARVRVGRLGGMLYAVNTAGATVGAIAAGFVLIPTIGVSGTTWVGVAASGLAVVAVLTLARSADDPPGGFVSSTTPVESPQGTEAADRQKKSRHGHHGSHSPDAERDHFHRARARARAKARQSAGESSRLEIPGFAAVVVGLSGCASLMFEITWTRVLALALGPTTYAFATTVAALIGGLACGSGLGAWVAGRTRRPAAWLTFTLTGAAVFASVACTLAGGEVPRRVAEQIAGVPDTFDRMLVRALLLGVFLIVPAAAGFGAAFPLALASIRHSSMPIARQVGLVYAINTIAAVAGSLLAGFVTIPMLGLQQTLHLVTVLLMLAGVVAAIRGKLSLRVRLYGLVGTAVSLAIFVFSPAWDLELLASGVYKYSAYVAKDLDLETALTAGTLLYYGEGAASTVTVKRLTGTTTLAIDGKVDASNGSDMLTQKLIAHLPLLLHENPREVCVIGVGSGVTLAAALRHPITGVDVVEISPEVVAASRFFATENRNALDDPRTHLIVGDGRSHLALSTRTYDVIISEPSNPWIAGVAALFTREFFVAARARLAPGGIMSQWAHTYNISAGDLRSIVATFTSVFPNGTVWMVGEDDVILVASNDPLDARMANVDQAWQRPGVAEDLREASAMEPFAIWSLFAGGPSELQQYTAGAMLQADDRMALEFSGPRAMDNRDAARNAASLMRLLDAQGGPPVVRQARAGATAAEWRNRGAMMLKANVPAIAYDDYSRAVTLDPNDAGGLDGLERTAALAGRVPLALEQVTALAGAHPLNPAIWVTKSKLLVDGGALDAAIEAARQAAEITPVQVIALDQLASMFAKMNDTEQLDVIVQKLQLTVPALAVTFHYAAVARLLHGEFAEAVKLGARAVAADPQFAAVYDVMGAAYLKLDQPEPARDAFQTSLRFNAHDSTAYTNLGILELQAGSRPAAARHFAEALWLDPESTTAREGLAQARQQ